ncbi:MAG: CCE_0567 family metalloprotein [Methylococcales bacterium]|nr:CCE_0567 family metalloprotein [Methylococcales bacterium]
MSDEVIKQLEKEVKKNKRLANEQAMVLHDLIEDSLPEGYGELMGIAQATYDACIAWDQANQKLKAAGG